MSSDFSSMDMSNYSSQLNEYQTGLNAALGSVAGANKTAQQKVDAFNQALATGTQIVAGPLVAKGIGKTIANVKSAITKKAGQKVDELKQAAEDKLAELKNTAQTKIDDLKNANPLTKEGDIPNDTPVQGVQETNLDQALAEQRQGPQPKPETQDEPLEGTGDAAAEDEFALKPIGAGSEAAASDAGDAAAAAAGDAAGDAGAAAAAGAGAAEGAGAAAGAGILEGTTVAAASEGFLNPILDLAPLAAGIGLVLAGLFGKHHDPPQKPPPPVSNPQMQFGL